jgi:hypothetical protein
VLSPSIYQEYAITFITNPSNPHGYALEYQKGAPFPPPGHPVVIRFDCASSKEDITTVDTSDKFAVVSDVGGCFLYFTKNEIINGCDEEFPWFPPDLEILAGSMEIFSTFFQEVGVTLIEPSSGSTLIKNSTEENKRFNKPLAYITDSACDADITERLVWDVNEKSDFSEIATIALSLSKISTARGVYNALSEKLELTTVPLSCPR